MTQIFTSFWKNPLLGEVDAVMVSTSRGRPQWALPFRYRRFDALAPSDETWALEDTERFAAAYVGQLERLGADAIVSELERIGAGRTTVALCWEKPGEFCHRRLLADFIEHKAGIEVPELRPGDLPQRVDVATPRLF